MQPFCNGIKLQQEEDITKQSLFHGDMLIVDTNFTWPKNVVVVRSTCWPQFRYVDNKNAVVRCSDHDLSRWCDNQLIGVIWKSIEWPTSIDG